MNEHKCIHIYKLTSTSKKLNFLSFVLKCLLSNLKGFNYSCSFHNVLLSMQTRVQIFIQYSYCSIFHHPLVTWTAHLWFFFHFVRSFLKCSKKNCTGYSSCSLVHHCRNGFCYPVVFQSVYCFWDYRPPIVVIKDQLLDPSFITLASRTSIYICHNHHSVKNCTNSFLPSLSSDLESSYLSVRTVFQSGKHKSIFQIMQIIFSILNILKLNISKISWMMSVEIKWNIHINYRTIMTKFVS